MKLFFSKYKNTIITISGNIGSGKTTVGKYLSEILSFEFISIGEIQRKIASDYKLSILELNSLYQNDSEMDEKIDSFIKSLKKSPSSMVIDSRIAWILIPESFKVYLKSDITVAAQRIIASKRKDELYSSQDEAILDIGSREKMELQRLNNRYKIDTGNPKNHDVIINTSQLKIQEVVAIILQHLFKFTDNRR